MVNNLQKVILSSLYGTIGKPMGLVNKLQTATSSKQVESLLTEGNQYAYASPKTKRRWKYVAVRKLKELQLLQEKQSAVAKKTEKAETDPPPKKVKKQKG